MARTIHNDGSGGIQFCNCCQTCNCTNCQEGTILCPNIVGRIQGEDLQSAHATDVTSGASLPTFVFDDAGFDALTVEVTSVQYPLVTKTFEYIGGTDADRRDNLKSDMETWFNLTFGGTWTFDVQISGAGLIINSIACIASLTNISEMFFYEDLSGSHESDHTDFNNTPHQNACVVAALTDNLWTTGATHSGVAPCTYRYNAALGSGCGDLVSTISIGASVISLTVQINDDSGEIISAVFQSSACAPFECDSTHDLQLTSFNAGEDPNTNTLVDWTGATATYAAGEPAPSVPCAIPTAPNVTTLTMLGDVDPCVSCTPGTPINKNLSGLVSGTNLTGGTTFAVLNHNSLTTPTISGSVLTVTPTYEEDVISVEVQATNNGIKDSAGILCETDCCACQSGLFLDSSVRELVNPDDLPTTYIFDESRLLDETVPTDSDPIGVFTRWVRLVPSDADTYTANSELQERGRRWEFGHEWPTGTIGFLRFRSVYRDGNSTTDVGSVTLELWDNAGVVGTVDVTSEFNAAPASLANDPSAVTDFDIDVSAIGPIKSFVIKQGTTASNYPSWIRIGEVQPLVNDCSEPCTGYEYISPQTFTFGSSPYTINNFAASGTGGSWGTPTVDSYTVTQGSGVVIDNLDGTITYEKAVSDTDVEIEVTYTDGTAPVGCDATIVSSFSVCQTLNPTITTDTTPTNPCVVPTTFSYNEDPCLPLISETLTVTHAGGTDPIDLPLLGNNLKLDDYQGEIVTLTYEINSGCGTEQVTENVTVPSFNNVYTVNPDLPVSATNFQTLTAGVAALGNGDKLIIEPRTYVINSGSEGSRIDLNNKKDSCITTSSGVATLDCSAVTLTNGSVRTSRASGSYFSNLEIINGNTWALYSEDMGNAVYENINIHETGTGVTSIGMYIYDGKNVTVIGGDLSNNEGTGLVVGGPGPADFGNDVTIDGVISNFNGRDGINTNNNRDLIIRNSTFGWNRRSGVIVIGEGSQGALLENNLILQNEDAGVQIENAASGVTVRRNKIRGNNTYITGGGGEAGMWLDQNSNCVIEYNDISENHTGIRIAANLAGSNKTETNDVIVRYNRVYDNNAQITEDYGGNEAALEIKHSERIHIYHNTFSKNGNTSTSGGVGKNGIEFFPESSSGSLTGIVTNSVYFLNNIVTETIAKTGARTMSLNALSELDVLDANVYFGSPDTLPYEIGGSSYNFANYQTVAGGSGFEANSVESDPLLDDDLVPQPGSPALGAAIDLAEITFISGLDIGLNYPGMFTSGDIVEFPDGSIATVSGVDANSITVDAVPGTAAVSQGVTLFDCDGTTSAGAVQPNWTLDTVNLSGCPNCSGSNDLMTKQAWLRVSGVTNIAYPSNTTFWDFTGEDIAAWINQPHLVTLSCSSIVGGFSGAPEGYVSRIFEANNYSASNSGNNPYDVEVSIWMSMQATGQWRYTIFVDNVNDDSPPTAIGVLAQTSQFDGVNNGHNCLITDKADNTDLVIGSTPDRYLDTSAINIVAMPIV